MKINYLQSYDEDFNLSKGLNERIKLLPENEWICLTDCDTLKFPNFQTNLIKIVETATEMDLIGAMTNRLRPTNPAVINEMYNNDSISDHFLKADELWFKNKTKLEPTKVIAGNCMVFNKSLWSKIGGFNESKLFFDKYFSYAVKENGGRCLLAKGLYIFHLYRWDAVNPVMEVNHLLKPKKPLAT